MANGTVLRRLAPVIAALLGVAGFDGATFAAPPAPSAAPVVIYEGSYPGWPWVAAGADGTLHCVFRDGTEHDFSPSGRALISQSRDHGRTWTPARVIADAPEVDDRNVAITALKRSLLVVFNTYTRNRESLAVSTRSIDGGLTWSPPAPIGEPNTRTKAAPVLLRDGSLILPFYIAPGSGSLAARSTDDGRTWTTVRVPDTDGFVGDEWDVLEVSKGHLVGIIRNSHPRTDGFFWMTESRDRGKSWSTPRKTNVQSQRAPSPPQLCLQHGKPTLIYADRRMVSVSAVRPRSPSDFIHWDLDHRLPCFAYNADESPILDGSYPVSVPIGRHDRLIVDYEIRPGSKRITGHVVRFPRDW